MKNSHFTQVGLGRWRSPFYLTDYMVQTSFVRSSKSEQFMIEDGNLFRGDELLIFMEVSIVGQK